MRVPADENPALNKKLVPKNAVESMVARFSGSLKSLKSFSRNPLFPIDVSLEPVSKATVYPEMPLPLKAPSPIVSTFRGIFSVSDIDRLLAKLF